MVVMHVCDNPPCVNPRHLCLGTPGENIADCFAKGRRSTPHGENGYNAKLTAAQVAEIRRTYDGRRGSQTRIAREFGVSIATIHDIVHGRSWKEAA
jgi:DNA invertase Pin-like site-specific DNA recombinase